MNKSFRRIISVAIIILSISGCASTGNAPGTNPSNTDATRTKAEGTAVGAVVGGILGAAVAMATGHQKNVWGYAAAGAAAGGVGGYIAGNRVATIKQQYANEEQRLEAETKLAAQFNHEIIAQNTETQNQIDTLNQEISDMQSGNIKTQQQINGLETKKNTTEKMITDNKDKISNMNTELNALQQYKQSVAQTQNYQKVGQLEQEITTLQTNIAMLDQSNQQMAKTVESLNIRK